MGRSDMNVGDNAIVLFFVLRTAVRVSLSVGSERLLLASLLLYFVIYTEFLAKTCCAEIVELMWDGSAKYDILRLAIFMIYGMATAVCVLVFPNSIRYCGLAFRRRR